MQKSKFHIHMYIQKQKMNKTKIIEKWKNVFSLFLPLFFLKSAFMDFNA